jgi:hypothetical protein
MFNGENSGIILTLDHNLMEYLVLLLYTLRMSRTYINTLKMLCS